MDKKVMNSLLFFFSLFAFFFACLATLIQNTIYAVFCLILVFFNAFGICMCLGVNEFLAVVILIVYIGAVVILFLFTVIMIGGGEPSKREHLRFDSFFFLLLIKYFIFFCILVYVNESYYFFNWAQFFLDSSLNIAFRDYAKVLVFYSSDIRTFGLVLYTQASSLFYLITFVMLVTLIGSLVLALSYFKPTKLNDILVRKK